MRKSTKKELENLRELVAVYNARNKLVDEMVVLLERRHKMLEALFTMSIEIRDIQDQMIETLASQNEALRERAKWVEKNHSGGE